MYIYRRQNAQKTFTDNSPASTSRAKLFLCAPPPAPLESSRFSRFGTSLCVFFFVTQNLSNSGVSLHFVIFILFRLFQKVIFPFTTFTVFRTFYFTRDKLGGCNRIEFLSREVTIGYVSPKPSWGDLSRKCRFSQSELTFYRFVQSPNKNREYTPGVLSRGSSSSTEREVLS